MKRTEGPGEPKLVADASFVLRLIALPLLYLATAHVALFPSYVVSAMVEREPVTLMESMFMVEALILGVILIAGATYEIEIVGIKQLMEDAYFSTRTVGSIACRLGEFILAYQVAALAVLLVLAALLAASLISIKTLAITLLLAPVWLLVIQQSWFAPRNPRFPWQRYLFSFEPFRRVIAEPPDSDAVSTGRRAVRRFLIRFGCAAVVVAACLLIERLWPDTIKSPVLGSIILLAIFSSLLLALAAVLLLGNSEREVAVFLRSTKWLRLGIGALIIVVAIGVPLRLWTLESASVGDVFECSMTSGPASAGASSWERSYWSSACESAIAKRENDTFTLAGVSTLLGIGLLLAGLRMIRGARPARAMVRPKMDRS